MTSNTNMEEIILNHIAKNCRLAWKKNGGELLKINDNNLPSYKRIIKEIKQHKKEPNIESESNKSDNNENSNMFLNIKITNQLFFSSEINIEFNNILIPKQYPYIPCNIEEMNIKIKIQGKYIIFNNIKELFEYFKDEMCFVECLCVNYIESYSPTITLRTYFLQYAVDLNILFSKKREKIVSNIIYINTNKEIDRVCYNIVDYLGDDLNLLYL